MFFFMTFFQRSTCFMKMETAAEFLSELQELEGQPTLTGGTMADINCICLCVQAEVLRQVGDFEQALDVATRGIALQEMISDKLRGLGCIQYMTYVIAASYFKK